MNSDKFTRKGRVGPTRPRGRRVGSSYVSICCCFVYVSKYTFNCSGKLSWDWKKGILLLLLLLLLLIDDTFCGEWRKGLKEKEKKRESNCKSLVFNRWCTWSSFVALIYSTTGKGDSMMMLNPKGPRYFY